LNTFKIGLAGTGRMGCALVERLLGLGHSVTVWNRTAQKLTPLIEMGASVASSPSELVNQSELIMTLLTNEAAVHALYLGENGFLKTAGPGKLFLEMSTLRPTVHEHLAPQVLATGASYMDLPVGGTVGPAKAGQLFGLAGGDEKDFQKILPLLNTLCRRVEYLGQVGSGSRMKLAMNLMMQICWQSFGEALSLCKPLNLAPERLMDIMSESSGMPHGLKLRLPMMVKALHGTPISPVNFDVKSVRKDLNLMLKEAQSMGIPLPMAEMALSLFNQVSKEGRGDEDCGMLPMRWYQYSEDMRQRSSTPLKLYLGDVSGNSYKLRILLHLIGLKYESIFIDFEAHEHKKEPFIHLNPRGEVPVLDDNGTVLWDSSACLIYLARRYGGHQWYPSDPEEMAQIAQWMSLASTEIQCGLQYARRGVLRDRWTLGPLEKAQAFGSVALNCMEQRLSQHHWLALERPTLADIACFPYVESAPEGHTDLSPYPNVKAWIHRCRQLPNWPERLVPLNQPTDSRPQSRGLPHI
jgi:3-hydroxyisobutyrate dehydrogenase-like beta-hydroxyacid dehydrogenase/glutathione S-transferase